MPSSVSKQITADFLAWEQLGRGRLPVHDRTVEPEPPFRPFQGYSTLPNEGDSGRRVGMFGRLFDHDPAPIDSRQQEEEEKEEFLFFEDTDHEPPVEFTIHIPPDFSVAGDLFHQFLSHLGDMKHPLCFELVGLPKQVECRFVTRQPDADRFDQAFHAFFPDAGAVRRRETGLIEEWLAEECYSLVFEFGLTREFLYPIKSDKTDPHVNLVHALAGMSGGRGATYQVLFHPVTRPWAESMTRTVQTIRGTPVFDNAPELIRALDQKISEPLYAVVVRIAVRGRNKQEATDALFHVANALGSLSGFGGNTLEPLSNKGYEVTGHLCDFLTRQTRRFGMLLNRGELTRLAHLPGPEVQNQKFSRIFKRTRKAPAETVEGLTDIGVNEHRGEEQPVFLTADRRTRHIHVIGASGTGKSTFITRMILDDIRKGQGVAVLDPHGDLIDDITGNIPEERYKDVVLFDPCDPVASPAFNILSANSETEKALLSSDLVAVFERLSTSWGDRMSIILANAILAFLNSTRGGSLLDMKRFLLEKKFRDDFLTTVRSQQVIYFWKTGFPQMGGDKTVGPLITRLEFFLSLEPVLHLVAQRESTIDFADIMDTGKIFLARLSEGAIGKTNSALLGSLLVSKFQQIAMSRQALEASERRDFWLYIDEFYAFMTPSMAEILVGARKYRLGMLLAHQYLHQLKIDEQVGNAVLSNSATRVVFQLGDADAKGMAEGFENHTDTDIRMLDIGEAICRVGPSTRDFNLKVPLPEKNEPEIASEVIKTVTELSRATYCRPRVEIAKEIDEILMGESAKSVAEKKKEPSPPAPSGKTKEEVKPEKKQPSSPEPDNTDEELPIEEKPEPAPPEDQEQDPETDADAGTSADPPEQSEYPSMGRGGPEHKRIQQELRTAAHKAGFHANVEETVLDGKGSIDIVLRHRDDPNRKIACEISITTPLAHEMGNIRKCLDAGFTEIVMMAPKPARLMKLQQMALEKFTAEERKGLRFQLPEDFMESLGGKLKPSPKRKKRADPKAKISTTHGFKVVRRVAQKAKKTDPKAEEEILRLLVGKIKKTDDT